MDVKKLTAQLRAQIEKYVSIIDTNADKLTVSDVDVISGLGDYITEEFNQHVIDQLYRDARSRNLASGSTESTTIKDELLNLGKLLSKQKSLAVTLNDTPAKVTFTSISRVGSSLEITFTVSSRDKGLTWFGDELEIAIRRAIETKLNKYSFITLQTKNKKGMRGVKISLTKAYINKHKLV